MKRLSIITTLYNSARYLPKCLDSLLCQDIPESEYEIIVVNDGSPDDSMEIACEYARKSEAVRVFSQENQGVAGARNTGMRAATGKYLCFVDPDDYVLENSLKVVLDRMESEKLDVLRFGYTEVDEAYQPTQSCKYPETTDYSSRIMDGGAFLAERLGVACFVWTFIFRTALVKDNQIWFEKGVYFDDTPWLPRVLVKARRVDSMEYKRHFYLIRRNSLVRSHSEEGIARKMEGQRFLIHELVRQRSTCLDKRAQAWYGRMIAHCVNALLSTVALHRFTGRKAIIEELKQTKVFPLSMEGLSGPRRLKTALASQAPNLFCVIIHLKKALS